VHSQFYLSQNFETLRHCFKEAVLRRGVPRLMYTDYAEEKTKPKKCGVGAPRLYPRLIFRVSFA
jgi:hypothetical protein